MDSSQLTAEQIEFRDKILYGLMMVGRGYLPAYMENMSIDEILKEF